MTETLLPDTYFMNEALKEAHKALDKDEVPIGAIIACKSKIVARGYNQVEQLHDVTAHAEMIAITSAENHFLTKYLTDCTLYVTVEPCMMCATAIGWAQIKRLVYAAPDEKKGFTIFTTKVLHPKCEIVQGVMEEECSTLIKQFFARKRK
jgi:tRNA(adenine34) deaminase